MEALLLIPKQYSIHGVFESVFQQLGYNIKTFNYRSVISKFNQRINTQIYRLPARQRDFWDSFFLKKVNQLYIDLTNDNNPDIIVIYNNELLLPSTLKKWKREGKTIVFYLGDNPLYSRTNDYNLTILNEASLILVPDTFWKFQLEKMGFGPVEHFLIPFPENQYFEVKWNDQSQSKYATEVFYLGANYKISWGYKKARFLSYFTDYNLKIIGNDAWKKWFEFYPDLEKHFELSLGFMPTEELNLWYNYSKIVPVDGNAGIFNGIHARVVETLSAGTLPLMEYNTDIDFIFEGISDLPTVKDYRQIPEITSWYLKHEEKRKNKIDEMRKAYNSKFDQKAISGLIKNHI